MSLVSFLAMKASGRRVNMGGQKHVWLRCANVWQPPAVFSEAPSRVFSANFQVAFIPLQINAWRLARHRATETLETAFSGNFTDTCYELHFLCNLDVLQNLAPHFQPCTFFLACVLPVLCPVFYCARYFVVA